MNIKNKKVNTIVRVIMYSDSKKRNMTYECVGVLIKKEDKKIRIAFNAKENKIIDFLDIKKVNIVSITVIKNLNIKKINSLYQCLNIKTLFR